MIKEGDTIEFRIEPLNEPRLTLKHRILNYDQLLDLFKATYGEGGRLTNLVMDHCVVLGIPLSVQYVFLVESTSTPGRLLGWEVGTGILEDVRFFLADSDYQPSLWLRLKDLVWRHI